MPTTAADTTHGPDARRVQVAVGVIVDAARVLVSLRPQHVHQGGLWEFPGGKVEPGETVAAALERELFEELAIRPRRMQPLLQVCHDYADKAVLLDVWWVDDFLGEPLGREGQPLSWATADELRQLAFPAANAPILEAVLERLAAVA